MSGDVAGIVVAAGSGQRLGASIPKGLVPLAGRPLVAWAVTMFAEAQLPPPLVVHPAGAADAFVEALAGLPVAGLVAGGASRAASVRAGMKALDASAAIVAIHDAARPFMPFDVLVAAIAAVKAGAIAAAPGLAITDTLKRVDGRRITETVSRDDLVGIQTPQVFRRDVLERAIAGDADATDELALLEAARDAGAVDGRIEFVAGSPLGHKLTIPADAELLERLAAGGRP